MSGALFRSFFSLRISKFGKYGSFAVVPLPLRIFGINDLEENRKIIYELQSLTGKILSRK